MPKPRLPKSTIRTVLSHLMDDDGSRSSCSVSAGMRHKIRTLLFPKHEAAIANGCELSDSEIDLALYGATEHERDYPRFNIDRLNDAVRSGLKRQHALELSGFLELGCVPGYSWASEQHSRWLNSLPNGDLRLLPAGELCLVGSINAELIKRDADSTEQAFNIFVAILPVSQFCYFALYPTGCQLSWLQCFVDAFAYFGGVPLRVDVTSPFCDRRLYRGLERHYGLTTTVRKKTPSIREPIGETVRASCLDWISAHGDHLSKAVGIANARTVLRALNNKWNGTNRLTETGEYSANAFCQLDAQCLRSLPGRPFEPSKAAKVHVFDNHVEYSGNYYSVPFLLSGEEVDLKLVKGQLRIEFDGDVVAEHPLAKGKRTYVTDPSHRPSRRRLAETCDRIINMFYGIGADAVRWCRMVMKAEPDYVERCFRRCLSVVGLMNTFSAYRLNRALKKASETGRYFYGKILDLLKSNHRSSHRSSSVGGEFTIDRNHNTELGAHSADAITFGRTNRTCNVPATSVMAGGVPSWVVRVYERVSHGVCVRRLPAAGVGVVA